MSNIDHNGAEGAWNAVGNLVIMLIEGENPHPIPRDERAGYVQHVLATKGVPQNTEEALEWLGLLQTTIALAGIEKFLNAIEPPRG